MPRVFTIEALDFWKMDLLFAVNFALGPQSRLELAKLELAVKAKLVLMI